MTPTPLRIVAIESPLVGEIGYVAWRSGSDEAIVIDPGSVGPFLEQLQNEGLRPAAILMTHGHYDHIAGVAGLKAQWPEAPVLIGENEAQLLIDPIANLSAFGGASLTAPPADRLIKDGETFVLAGIELKALEIPGHSPGSMAYLLRDHEPALVFGGDVLFAGSVGRSDFPGGSGRTLVAGIRAKLFALPDETIVLPGHGPPTTIGQERRTNPYVN